MLHLISPILALERSASTSGDTALVPNVSLHDESFGSAGVNSPDGPNFETLHRDLLMFSTIVNSILQADAAVLKYSLSIGTCERAYDTSFGAQGQSVFLP